MLIVKDAAWCERIAKHRVAENSLGLSAKSEQTASFTINKLNMGWLTASLVGAVAMLVTRPIDGSTHLADV